jgi:hypothetical protein
VVLDVDRAVCARLRRDQKIGYAHAPALDVHWQAPFDDEARSGGDRGARSSFSFRWCPGPDDLRVRMEVEKDAEHVTLELFAAVKAALQFRRCGNRDGRNEYVVLGADRAVFR